MRNNKITVKKTVMTVAVMLAFMVVGISGVKGIENQMNMKDDIKLSKVNEDDITGKRYEVGNAVYTETEYKYCMDRMDSYIASGLDEDAARRQAITDTQDAIYELRMTFTQEDIDKMTDAEYQEYFGQ